jgi:hypothetical protein
MSYSKKKSGINNLKKISIIDVLQSHLSGRKEYMGPANKKKTLSIESYWKKKK